MHHVRPDWAECLWRTCKRWRCSKCLTAKCVILHRALLRRSCQDFQRWRKASLCCATQPVLGRGKNSFKEYASAALARAAVSLAACAGALTSPAARQAPAACGTVASKLTCLLSLIAFRSADMSRGTCIPNTASAAEQRAGGARQEAPLGPELCSSARHTRHPRRGVPARSCKGTWRAQGGKTCLQARLCRPVDGQSQVLGRTWAPDRMHWGTNPPAWGRTWVGNKWF